MILTILLVLFLLMALGGGGWGYSRYGGWSWSPAVVILLVGAVLFFTGSIHFG